MFSSIDDLLEELPDADFDLDDSLSAISEIESKSDSPLHRAVQAILYDRLNVLDSANKPIFVIPGNHDIIDIPCTFKNVYNVHSKKMQFNGFNVIGYRWTKLDRDEKSHKRDINRLAPYIDKKTILVTHDAPYGILDVNDHRVHIGSTYLRQMINEKEPRICLFGHVHESAGMQGKKYVNCAYPIISKFFSISLEGDHHQDSIDFVHSREMIFIYEE